MKTIEIEIPAERLGNFAWCRLRELLDDELSRQSPELAPVEEAETLLQFKKALAERADFLVIRLRYTEDAVTSHNRQTGG